MKAIFCGECFDFKALQSPDGTIVSCRCMSIKGEWIDGQKGRAKIRYLNATTARVIGIDNGFLRSAFDGLTDSGWKERHEQLIDAPGYLFDRSKRGCPVAIVSPYQTNDIVWEKME